MFKRSWNGLALCVLMMWFSAILSIKVRAHHGVAAYDMSRTITVTGVIEKVLYENPHGYIWLRVVDKVYYIELAALERMQNAGLTPELLKPGSIATIAGAPHRTDPLQMKTRRIIIGTRSIQLGPGMPATLSQQKPAAVSDLPDSTLEYLPAESGHSLLIRLENTAIAQAMRNRRLLYPIVEIIHILGIIVLVGSAALFDLRLLGIGKQISLVQLSRYVLPAARWSVLAVVPAGIFMFMSNATTLAANPVFRLKLGLIGLAVLNAFFFHRWSGKSLEAWGQSTPNTAKLSAALSLIIWVGVVSCGRLLAFF